MAADGGAAEFAGEVLGPGAVDEVPFAGAGVVEPYLGRVLPAPSRRPAGATTVTNCQLSSLSKMAVAPV